MGWLIPARRTSSAEIDTPGISFLRVHTRALGWVPPWPPASMLQHSGGPPAAPVDNLGERLARSAQVRWRLIGVPDRDRPNRTELLGHTKGLLVSADSLLGNAKEACSKALVDGRQQHQERCKAGVDVPIRSRPPIRGAIAVALVGH